MKKYLIFIGIIVFFFACHKESVEIFSPGEQTYGFMTASKRVGKSDSKWEAGGGALLDINYPGLFGIYGTTQDEYGQMREELSLFQIPLLPGKGLYQIEEGKHQNNNLPIGNYARLTSDGDVLGANYYVKPNSNSWIEIIEIDTISKIVKGRFEVHFEVSSNYEDRGFPKEVHFEDGYFEVEIWK